MIRSFSCVQTKILSTTTLLQVAYRYGRTLAPGEQGAFQLEFTLAPA
jgi:hypothetical protein